MTLSLSLKAYHLRVSQRAAVESMATQKVFVLFFGILSSQLVPVASDNSIALGKPTTHSSTYYGLSSSLAVDGNYEPAFAGMSCFHASEEDLEPWWVVDLQGVFSLSSVKIYNRDTKLDRLDNITVEAFLGDPQLCPTQGSVCGFNPGPSGDLVTINCSNTLARFLRVSGQSALTFCELDLFGEPYTELPECGQKTMNIQYQKKLTGSFLHIGTTLTPNDCLAKCHHRPGPCSIFNYNVLDGSCVILPESTNPLSSSDLTTDVAWNLYYTC